MIIVAPSFSKSSSVSKVLQLEERFRKDPFSCRISVDGRPNHRNKAVFSNFSVVWTGHSFY